MAILLAPSLRVSKASIIGFDGIPDHTAVSTGNAYSGILVIEAASTPVGLPGSTPPPTEGLIRSEVMSGSPFQKEDVLTVIPEFAGLFFDYESHVTATFLAPVTHVSFNTFEWRVAGYSYVGVHANGESFTGSGVTGSVLETGQGWHVIDLSLPDGDYLTQFALSNRDPNPNNAAILLDDIRFTVPEGGEPVLLLALSCAGLAALRMRWQIRTRL
jgi:hypothetical protein